jgi:hypothetical protein
MATGDDNLRALIRLIPPARALKQDLEKQLHLEMYSGLGDAAVRTFMGLRDSVARLTDDPYVDALSLESSPEATDREKVSLVVLAAGQLVAYLEGQTGLVGMGGNHSVTIQTAPKINMGPVHGVESDVLRSLLGGKRRDEDESEEESDEDDE